MPRFKKNKLWKHFILPPLLSILLGFAQVSDKLFIALPCIALLFLIYENTRSFSLRTRLVCVQISVTLYMMSVTAWFRNIEAFGWQNIAHLPPQFWLLVAVLISSMFCALAAVLLFFAAEQVRKRIVLIDKSPIAIAYIWALVMTTTEIGISTFFSLFSRASGASVEPTWNMYSLALLTATNQLGSIARFTGFWGTSFVLYFACALFGLLIWTLIKRTKPNIQLVVALPTLIAAILVGILLPSSSHPGDNVRLVAVSEPSSDTSYLEKLQYNLSDDLKKQPETTRIVILPEYSNLLSPYANTSFLSFNYDARYAYPERFQSENIYFVGTEDHFLDGKRYAENYVVNGNLNKIKRQPKTFLIPGGEYVVGWVGAVITTINKDSAALFQATRVRNVIQQIPEPEASDPISKKIGIGACSNILLPYKFRKQANEGAEFFAINVSYEQFKKAPEYQQFANRFARFTARATSRPFAIGAFSGPAVIYDSSGEHIARSGDNNLALSNITGEKNKTPYTKLGDTLILFFLSMPLLAVVLVRISKKLIAFLQKVKT